MTQNNNIEDTANTPAEEPFRILDILDYEKMFDMAGIENGSSIGDQSFFWIMVLVYYIILFIPTWVVVRCLLFLILPKSWLKKMFDV